MDKAIQSALISVFNKDGLEPVIRRLAELGVTLYSTGGTRQFIESLGLSCLAVEDLTGYPSILGGRVKTLHPKVFGGILGRSANEQDREEMSTYEIPAFDLVMVDLYPFEATIAGTSDEKAIIEKIDIGGVSLIRAAAKNFADVAIVAHKNDYTELESLLLTQNGTTSLEQRRSLAAKAFAVCAQYDVAIANWFNPASPEYFQVSASPRMHLRYGENPHQAAGFYGQLEEWVEQLHGKELSYNNLTDLDAALQLIAEFSDTCFAIIKHTNVCGIAVRPTVKEAWDAALAGDPESAFGGVLVCNREIDSATATAINELFFEVLVAPGFDAAAMEILQSKKNRILLRLKANAGSGMQVKSLLNGLLVQEQNTGNTQKWEEAGGRESTDAEKKDLQFANLVCKHLKSNAIALVKQQQLIGKGCGQTSRIDALRHALEKAKQFQFDLNGAVMASDAFFPFNDCVKMGHEAGITAFIQPGGSIRDKDSIAYCQEAGLVMVMTGQRHFRH